jgi:hypothetical protein
MNFRKVFALFLCVILTAGSMLTVYGNNTHNGSVMLENTQVSKEILLEASKGLEQVAESENIVMFLDQSKSMIRLVFKETGAYIDSKIFDGEAGNGTTKNTQKSDLLFSYLIETKGNSSITISTMDNYTLSVELDGVTYEKLDQGVRVKYEIGDTSITYNDFPKFISEERMNELVIKNLNSMQKQLVTTTYYRLSQGVYVRKSGEDIPLGKLAAKELYTFFYEKGTYTTEDLEADNLEHGVEITSANQHISAIIEYMLDGDDLLVKVPVSEIVSEEQFPIQSIDILPYFLTGRTDEEGYLFIPDGSGAIINFNNQKVSEYPYASRYYGGDKLIGADTYKEDLENLNFPVFGIKKSDYAVLGIIEKGASIATVNANVSGMVDEFNKINLNFVIRDIDYISASNVSNYTIPKYSTDDYKDDIIIRYQFLTGNKANYTGMAKAYQQYLVQNGTLEENEVEKDAPIYVEVLGAIDKKKFFLGIPYTTTIPLTTFEQATDILESLKSKNINNVKLIYTGLANGGLHQRSIESVDIVNSLGGKKGLSNLATYVESIGADLFPNFLLQTAITGKGLSKSMQPALLNGAIAQLYEFDLVTRKPITDNKYPTRIIAGESLDKYLSKFADSYNKLGISNLASSDIATFIAANYKKNNNVSMSNSKHYYVETLTDLSEKYNLMLSNPIDFAYKYTSYITDLPVKSNQNKLIDSDIPFAQMVLEGYINYSMPAINTKKLTLQEELMKAIETKSSLKFRFTYENASVLKNTDFNNIFMAQYDLWDEKIGDYYNQYNEFYDLVKAATITNHTIIDGDDNLRVVEYSNGITIYLNYGTTKAMIRGVTVEPSSYVIL